MADTTTIKVKAIAGHLKRMSNGDLQVHIDDAKLEVADQKVPEKHEERLQRYLAAHLATLSVPRPTNKKVSDLSVTFTRADGLNLEGTEYGQEYQRLLGQIKGTGPGMASMKVF